MKKVLLLFMLISNITKAQTTNQQFKNSHNRKAGNEVLGKNIISFTPFGLTMSSEQQMPDMNISLSYEHISNNGYIGLKLPVAASLYNPYFYVMPTVKLYPAKQGNARYAIGPQLLIATGKVKVPSLMNAVTGEYELVSKRKTQFGFLLNNSFNFTIARHMYAGIDLSLGVIYFDSAPNAVFNSNNRYYNTANQNSNNIRPCTNIGFNMGYRF